MRLCSFLAPLIPKRTFKIDNKELFKVFRCCVDTFLKIIVIRTDESISEIPRIIGKNAVADIEPEGAKILYYKDSCCPCVSFTERVYLPYLPIPDLKI